MNPSILEAAGDVARCLLDELADDGVRTDSIVLLSVLARIHDEIVAGRPVPLLTARRAVLAAPASHPRMLAAVDALVGHVLHARPALDKDTMALLGVLARLHRELASPDGLTADSGQDLVALAYGRWPLEELAPADVVQHAFGGARRDAVAPVDAAGAAAVGGSTSTVPHPSPAVVVAGGADHPDLNPGRSIGAGGGSPETRRTR